MSETEKTVICWVLQQSKATDIKLIKSFEDWKTNAHEIAGCFVKPADRAVGLGFTADKIAFAFLSGFHTALESLLPFLKVDQAAAFCISEKEGNHPQQIKTSISKETQDEKLWRLNGVKTFVTCATKADVLFIAVSAGVDESGRNKLRLVQIDSKSKGVSIESLKPLGFIPEIDHGCVQLDGVIIDDHQILPGDGYTKYIKPFRILEEMHVSAALLGYICRKSFQHKWSTVIRERVISLIVLIQQLLAMDPASSSLHIAFAGFQQQMNTLMGDLLPCWEAVGQEQKNEWLRDIQVFSIAETARKKRLIKAWSEYN